MGRNVLRLHVLLVVLSTKTLLTRCQMAYDDTQCIRNNGYCVEDVECCPHAYFVTHLCGAESTWMCCLNVPDCNWRAAEQDRSLWPVGNFGLLRTVYDCPPSENLRWVHSSSVLDTTGAHAWSMHFHLLGPITPQRLTLQFCVKIENFLSEADQERQMAWPPGAYCIFRIGDVCPNGFTEGSASMPFPAGSGSSDPLSPVQVNGSDVTMGFCCRQDADPGIKKMFPANGQFTLLKIGEWCQEVSYMFVTEEDVTFALAESDTSSDVMVTSGLTPNLNESDGRITMSFCYYQEYENCYHEEDEGLSYSGLVSVTRSGDPCLAWNQTGELLYILIDNLCRNVLGYLPHPGCSGQNLEEVRYDCGVPACDFDMTEYVTFSSELAVRATRQGQDPLSSHLAFDGDVLTCANQNYYEGGSWWQLDMQANFQVHAVNMWFVMVEGFVSWINMMDIYVGRAMDDFHDIGSLYCRRNISMRIHNLHGFVQCIQPVSGHYLTIRNSAHEEYSVVAPYGTFGFSLCEIEVLVKEVDCGQPFGFLDIQSPGQYVPSSGDPTNAGLYSTGSWCADAEDPNPSIMIDLTQGRSVDALETQGGTGDDSIQMVETFSLQYGLYSDRMLNYTEDGQEAKVFHMGQNPSTPKLHVLRQPVYARYLKISVISWSGAPCMRVGIRGCTKKAANLALDKDWGYTSSVQMQTEAAVTDGHPDTCIVTSAEGAPRVWVDLGSSHFVSDITVRHDTNAGGYRMCHYPYDLGYSYAGPANVTYDGTPCLDWIDTAHASFIGYEYAPGYSNLYYDNYCRNGYLVFHGPSCFTDHAASVEADDMEYCGVPGCDVYFYPYEIWVKADTSADWVLCAEKYTWGMAEVFTFQCESPALARFVELRSKQSPAVLYVCEMEIYGFTEASPALATGMMSSEVTCAAGTAAVLQNVIPVFSEMDEISAQWPRVTETALDFIMAACGGTSNTCHVPHDLNIIGFNEPGQTYAVAFGCQQMRMSNLTETVVDTPGTFLSTWNYLTVFGNVDWNYWVVQASQGRFVKLTFITVELLAPEAAIQEGTYVQETGGCKDGIYVTYILEDESNAPRLVAAQEYVFISSTSQLRVEMQTCRRYQTFPSSFANERKLNAEFETEICPGCAVQYSCTGTDHSCMSGCGLLMSPGYGTDYDANLDCQWTVTVAPSDSIELSVLFMDIPHETSADCTMDHLEILDVELDGTQASLGQYCNIYRPLAAFESGWNNLVVRFQTNADELRGKGFRLSYQSISYLVDSTNQSSSDIECNEGWVAVQAKCLLYQREPAPVTWLVAEALCNARRPGQQPHLLSIHSEQEAELVHAMLLEQSDSQTRFYIGLNDREYEGYWQWPDNSAVSYTNWESSETGVGQPDGGEIEGCTMISLTSRRLRQNWQDIPCAWEGTASFICSYRPTVELEPVNLDDAITTTGCGGDLFRCASGECIQVSFLCDGVLDCFDASDESQCASTVDACPWYSFSCGDGSCVSLSVVCDYKEDCSLGQDEDWCVHRNCTSGEFQCANGECLPESSRCDLLTDCWDASDEEGCTFCQSNVTFQCFDGSCLPSTQVCDATGDCDGRLVEDEAEICASEMPVSCGDWRQAGYTEDGYYEINPDRTGAIRVECDMTSQPGQVVTLLHHNSEDIIDVSGYEALASYVRHFDYYATQDQVVALKASSSRCEQWWEIACFRAEYYVEGQVFWRSLATGEYYDYSVRGNNTCDCVMSQACERGLSRCNCYDPTEMPIWSGDAGMVTFEVPISEMQGSDTGGLWEAVWYDIGPLRCYQDYDEAEVNYRCKNGQVYNGQYRCLFSRDQYGVIESCRDVTHLQGCEEWQCPTGYVKCPDSYCIETRMVCNGQIDCPLGEEEMQCGNLNCSGLYACRNSLQCLPLSQRCDGIRHCEHGDDEWFCELSCPVQCQCNALAYNCQGGNLESIPATIDTAAKKLDLSENSISLHSTMFEAYPDLVVLILAMNSIRTLPESLFAPLPVLRTLDLSDNLIDTLATDAFLGLSNLISLDLLGNPLMYLEPGCFQGLSLLPELQLRDMQLGILQTGTFRGLSSMMKLDVSDNYLTTIELDALDDVMAVKHINMSRNHIQSFFKSDFEQLNSLEYLESDDYMFCCFVNDVLPPEQCLPIADEFSSCTDLMKNDILRVALWLLGTLAFLGNMFVLVWRSSGREKQSVASFLVGSLAAADLMMSFYLIGIAAVDYHFRGVYIENATAWRSSNLCAFLGVISAMSSETSVFTLCVITGDRLLNIVAPFSRLRLNLVSARLVILAVWLAVLMLAVIPLLPSDYFAGTFYSRSGVCISIHITNEQTPGWEYSVAIFHGLNFFTFVFIMSAYGYMFQIIKKSGKAAGSDAQKRELAAARKMTLIVLSDFCCWAPINLMGVLAMGGVRIPGEVYAWVVVFVLPVNSALNPVLYTVSSLSIYRKQKARDRRLASSNASIKSVSQVTILSEPTRENTMSFEQLLGTIAFGDFSRVVKVSRSVLKIIEQIHLNGMFLGPFEGKSMTFEDIGGKIVVSMRSNPRSHEINPNGVAEDMESFSRILSRLLRTVVMESKN